MNEKLYAGGRLALGEVVVLKSGGPDMTVTDSFSIDDNLVACHWFDGAVLTRDVFDAPELVKKPNPE